MRIRSIGFAFSYEINRTRCILAIGKIHGEYLLLRHLTSNSSKGIMRQVVNYTLYSRTNAYISYVYLRLESEMCLQNKKILDIIMERTSYRGKYKDTPVKREDLIKIMQAGLAAPSGCNKQTTSLIAVDDHNVLCDLLKLIDPPICETAPAIICVLTQSVFAYRSKCYHIQDYSAAIENMLIAMKALGYESCWYEGHITDDDDDIALKLADKLNVPKDYRLVCILPIGYAEEEVVKVKKKPFEHRAWFNGFNKE